MKRYQFLTFATLFGLTLFTIMSNHRTKISYDKTPIDVAVGFNLALDCGTVAYRDANGSLTNVARVDASAQYKDMMRRLSHHSSAHLSPPYGSLEEMWDDIPRQLYRGLRKAIGLPASSDVGILSKMLAQLRTEVESHLSQNVDAAVISYSTLPGLYEEAIRDAADYLGIRMLEGYYHHQPRQIFAAYAGYGMGMCDRRGSFQECQDELLALPVREVLHAECTSTALVLHVRRMRTAIDGAIAAVTAFSDFEDDNTPGSPFDSPRLGHSVRQILERYYDFFDVPQEMMVILSGERGNESSVVKAISEAVTRFGPVPQVLNEQVDFISARGAAELAWRAVNR